MKLKHKITAGLGAAALLASVTLPVFALTEGSVSATVTPQLISLTVADGGIEYGTLGVSTVRTTAINDSDSLNDTQTVTNNGNVAEDFDIKGVSSDDWTLAGTAGVEQYVHEFCRGDTGNCDGTPVFTALTTSYAELDTGVTASGGTQDFDLKITTPSSTAATAEQSVNVTVLATAS